MEEEGKGQGVVKHVGLVKFKEGISDQEIDDCFKRFASLVSVIASLKAFAWGKDVSIENMQQGYTHVLKATFETNQGIAEFILNTSLLQTS